MLTKKEFNRLLCLLAVLVAAMLTMTACKGKKSDDAAVDSTSGTEEAAATVNGATILKGDLDAIVKMYSDMGMGAGQGAEMDEVQKAELRTKMLDQMIEGELLYQESKNHPAENIDMKVEEEYQNILSRFPSEEAFAADAKSKNLTLDKVKENLRKNAVIQNFMDTVIVAKIQVSEDSIKEYYEANKNQFAHPEQIKASHILCKTTDNPGSGEEATQEQKDEAMKRIKAVQARLKKGDDFATVAKELSEGPSNVNGGDLGYFGKGQMVPSFEETAFKTKVGEVSDIVESPFGYHIIKVFDKKAEGTDSLEDALPKIEETLKGEEFKETVMALIKDLRTKANIEIK